jgi:hypothetical protein
MKKSILGFSLDPQTNVTIPVQPEGHAIGAIMVMGGVITVTVSTELDLQLSGVGINLKPSSVTIAGNTVTGKLKAVVNGLECLSNEMTNDRLTFTFNFGSDLNVQLANLIMGVTHFTKFISRRSSDLHIRQLALDLQSDPIATFIAVSDAATLVFPYCFNIMDSIVIRPPLPPLSNTIKCFCPSISLSKEAINAIIHPFDHYIPIHPDSYSLNINSYPNADFSNNSIKYSFVLVNGSLLLAHDNISSSVKWGQGFMGPNASLQGAHPALLALHSIDEHGHPLAIRNETLLYELNFREGTSSITANQFKFTLQGITPSTVNDCTLHSISHQSIDFEKKALQLIKHKNTTGVIDQPYWLPDDGKVVIEPEPPLAIHGLTRSGWFELKKDAANKYPATISGKLITAVHPEGVYEFLSLQLNTSDWILKAQYEERESKPEAGADLSPGFSIIDGRSFTGENADFHLPVTDYLFGASNIFDVNGVAPSEINDFVHDHIKIHNNTIIQTFSATPVDQVHATGFTRKHNEPGGDLAVQDLYTIAPLRVNTPVEIKIYPPNVGKRSITAQPQIQPQAELLSESESAPATEPQSVLFQHGAGKQGTDNSGILKKLQRVWNEYPLIIEELRADVNNPFFKVAEATGRIKQFIEGLGDVNSESDLRVKSVKLAEKEIFFRLKLEYIAPDPATLEKLADTVKAVIYGNIASLPGIGNRTFQLRKWADNYLSNTTKTWKDILQHYWDKAWEDCKEEEERVLYAVFDLVYKACDRQLLGKLIAMVTAVDTAVNTIKTDLNTVFDYLKVTPADLEQQFTEDAEQLLTEVAQGVDPYFAVLRQTWDQLVNEDTCPGISAKIKGRYNKSLNLDTYKKLVEDIKGGANSPVVMDILTCLKKQFRIRMRRLFEQEINKAIILAIDKLAEFLQPFQEQLIAFYLYIKRASDIFLKIEDLKDKLTNVRTVQDVRSLADDPLMAAFVYPEIRKLALLYKAPLAAALRPLAEIQSTLKQVLIDHEDDIFQVILIINDIETLLTEWQRLKTLIVDIKTCPEGDHNCERQKLKVFFKKDHNSRVLFLLGGLINDEFGAEVAEVGKDIADSVGAAVDKFIDDHAEKILLLLNTFFEVKEAVDKWQKIADHIRKDLRELQQDLKTFLDTLQGEGLKDIFLNLLKFYLLEKYQIDLDILNLRVEPPEYVAYGKNVNFNTDGSFRDKLFRLIEMLHINKIGLCEFADLGKTWGLFLNEQSVYILKLGNDMDLAQILREVNDTNKKPGMEKGPFPDIDDIISKLHPEVNTKIWRGLFILHPFADLGKDQLIADLIGRTSLKMTYAAVSLKKGASTNPFDIYAHIKEEAALMDIDSIAGDPDTHLALIRFEAVIRNTSLESGEALLKLKFKDVFGQKFDNGPVELDIHGSVGKPKGGAKDKQEFEFSAVLPTPLTIDLKAVPLLKNIVIKGIRAEQKKDGSKLSINADLNFQNINFLIGVSNITMSNFAITLPASSGGAETPPGKPRGVNFDIGAIRYVISKPRSLNIGGIEIIPQSIGYIKKLNADLYNTLFSSVLPVAGHRPQATDEKCVYIDVRVEMGELPLLGGAGSNLNFEGILASNLNTGNVFFGLKSVSADYISIDLFRFISLYIRRLIIGDVELKGGRPATFFGIHDLKLKILDWDPLKDKQVSAFVLHDKPEAGKFNQTPQKGFLALYNDDDPDGFLKLHWLLLAKNLALDEKVLTALLEPGKEGVQHLLQEAFGSLNDTGEMQQLKASGGDYSGNTSYAPEKPIPAGNKLNSIGFSNDNTWLFGVSFGLGDILDRCTLVLQDRHFYGIQLSSSQPWFSAIFGTDHLTLAYIPGPTRQTDRFRIELRLDHLDFLAGLRSGMVAIEMALNKDFIFDLGFPWLVGNTYMMERTFSAGTGVEIRWGAYIQKTTVTDGTNNLVTLGAGIALSYGYKVGARSAFAWAEAGIGVFMVFSGSITFIMSGSGAFSLLSARIKKLEATGVIGIYAYAEGGINYWIISASIKAWLVAAIQGHLLYEPGGNSSIDFSAVLSLHYQASARLKIGFVKIEVRISGELAYGVSGRIALN